ncbi:MAG: hypothetical protein NVSMB4_01550 [Acidimicrobiales bacterium]
MTKHRASRHRIPVERLTYTADEVSDRYQAEVDSSVTRLSRRYEAARKHLATAEAKRARLLAQPATKAHELADLGALIEQRRSELRAIELLMMPGDYAPVGYKPVPQ